MGMEKQTNLDENAIFSIQRPAPILLKYYVLTSLVLGPLFFIPLIPLYFRYHTLRYRFDSEGISMRWGILFRREINLTYARVQDIHLRSNLLERWLGLARLEVQTASGSSGAEMVLEGLPAYETIRDYLYSKMRGGHGKKKVGGPSGPPAAGTSSDGEMTAELIATLREVTSEVRALRTVLEDRNGDESGG